MTIHTPRIRTATGIAAQSFGTEVPFRPFILVDLFDMDRDVFPPHPHAGVCVLTYLLPESATALRNRDDLGNDLVIEPGALHWTTAGAGIVHHEAPVVAGARALGLQIFVDLPPDQRSRPGGILDLAAVDVPTADRDGVRVRCILGPFGALRSPLAPPVGIGLADVELAPRAVVDAAMPGMGRAFVFVERGAATVNGERATAGRMIGVALNGAALAMEADDAGMRAFVFSVPVERADA